MKTLSLAILWLALFAAPALGANSVIPTDAVKARVVLRSAPTTASQDLGSLRPGERAAYIDEVPGWVHARLDDGTEGYLSNHWVEVVADTAGGFGTEFSLEAIDVGTGLSVLVQGDDFVLLYDAGSNDDLARGSKNRVTAYLAATRPGLTDIDHVILSHPHRDHVELLPDVFAGYAVKNVWNSGDVNPICGYRAFLEAIRDEPGVTYHTADRDSGPEDVSFAATTCYTAPVPAETVHLNHGTRITAPETVQLGTNASMTFLYADGSPHPDDYNKNSLVVRVDLADKRILLMGDAQAGEREAPDNPADPDSIEGKLLACCATDLKADLLVVGHHGSMTSSRGALLDAVGASTFIVSSGPTKYGSVTLPDKVIIDELKSRGQVFRTDIGDATCAQNHAKIGPDADGKAGGCDNVRASIGSGVPISISYWRGSD